MGHGLDAHTKPSVPAGTDEVGVPIAFADCLREADALVADAFWKPWRTRMTRKKRLKELHEHVDAALKNHRELSRSANTWFRYRGLVESPFSE
jgi:hypothetical protein